MISSRIMPQLVDQMGVHDTGVETMQSAGRFRGFVDSNGASARADRIAVRMHGVKPVKNDLVAR